MVFIISAKKWNSENNGIDEKLLKIKERNKI